MPEGLVSIGDFAFFGMQLRSIDFPDSLKSIGSNAFAYNMFTEVTIPENVEEIGGKAFHYCSNLSTVKILDNITVLEEDLFHNSHKLKQLYLPETVKEIKRKALSGCAELEIIFEGSEEQWTKSGYR